MAMLCARRPRKRKQDPGAEIAPKVAYMATAPQKIDTAGGGICQQLVLGLGRRCGFGATESAKRKRGAEAAPAPEPRPFTVVIDDYSTLAISYYLHNDREAGVLHREDGPAYIEHGFAGTRIQRYYRWGQLHREDGPAVIAVTPNGIHTAEWHRHGVLLRCEQSR